MAKKKNKNSLFIWTFCSEKIFFNYIFCLFKKLFLFLIKKTKRKNRSKKKNSLFTQFNNITVSSVFGGKKKKRETLFLVYVRFKFVFSSFLLTLFFLTINLCQKKTKTKTDILYNFHKKKKKYWRSGKKE